MTSRTEKFVQAFSGMAEKAEFEHAHQISGWTDIKTKEEWENYVEDIFSQPDCRTFCESHLKQQKQTLQPTQTAEATTVAEAERAAASDDGRSLSSPEDQEHQEEHHGTQETQEQDAQHEHEQAEEEQVDENIPQVFEVGCGVLGFLNVLVKMYPNIVLHGIDGAEPAIEKCKTMLPAIADHFTTGLAPQALESYPTASMDLVVANSVFQYLDCHETARQTVMEMLRLAKPGALVLISDICDVSFVHQNDERVRQLAWVASTLPVESLDTGIYLHFERSWFDQFLPFTSRIVIDQIKTPSYLRRHERFNVYLFKSGP